MNVPKKHGDSNRQSRSTKRLYNVIEYAFDYVLEFAPMQLKGGPNMTGCVSNHREFELNRLGQEINN